MIHKCYHCLRHYPRLVNGVCSSCLSNLKVEIYKKPDPAYQGIPRPSVYLKEAKAVMGHICDNGELAVEFDEIGIMWMTGASAAEIREAMNSLFTRAIESYENHKKERGE